MFHPIVQKGTVLWQNTNLHGLKDCDLWLHLVGATLIKNML